MSNPSRKWALKPDGAVDGPSKCPGEMRTAGEFKPAHREGEKTWPGLDQAVRCHLGSALRTVLEHELSREPIPNAQVDLLLALRHRERDRNRR